MKILQLNVWMGKVEGNLRRFLEKNQFDVICMQEVFASPDRAEHLSRLCFDLSQILKTTGMKHHFYSPNWSGEIAGGEMQWGNLILSRIPFMRTQSEFIHGEYKTHTVLGQTIGNNLNLQIAQLENGFTIVNHHGFWRPQPMGDGKSVKAFEKVAESVRQLDGPVVMCGDLNIIHDSPAMRPLDFLRDLTHEYHIENTLSGLKYDGAVACDHILVNDRVAVDDFRVYPDLVSDHLPLSADVRII